jgi:hypothetical protein
MQKQTFHSLPSKFISLDKAHIFIKIYINAKTEVTSISSPAWGDFQLRCTCVNTDIAATSLTPLCCVTSKREPAGALLLQFALPHVLGDKDNTELFWKQEAVS